MRLLRRKFLWIAVLTTFILGCGVFAIVQMLAVPVRDEPSFEPRIGYTGIPPDPRLVRMIARAERDYNLFPIRAGIAASCVSTKLCLKETTVSASVLSYSRPVGP